MPKVESNGACQMHEISAPDQAGAFPDFLDVKFCCMRRNAEGVGNFLVRHTLRDQIDGLLLAWREVIAQGRKSWFARSKACR